MKELLMQQRWPLAYLGAAMAVLVLTLASMGRVPWCSTGVGLWTWESAGACTSQHLGDPYSLTHVEHGFLFYGLAALAFRKPVGAKAFYAATTLEVIWEVFENTPWVIDRYRAQTMAVGYYGDSILNSCGDLLACCLGATLAAKLPLKWTLLSALAIELLLLLLMRDNLTLNVLMLVFPLQGLQQWQMQGG